MTNRGARSRRPALRVLLATFVAMAMVALGMPAAGAIAGTGDTLGTAVLKIGSTITLSPSANPVSPNANETLTATFAVVAGNTDVSPSGDVTFLDGGSPLGTGTLSGQSATWTGKLPLGSHTVTATFDGDANYTSGASDPLTLNATYIPALAITVAGGSTTLPNDGSWSPNIYVSADSDANASDMPHTRFTVDFSGIAGMTADHLKLQDDSSGDWTDVTLTDQPNGDVTASVGTDSPLTASHSTGVTLRLHTVGSTPEGTLTMGAALLSSPDGVDWSDVVASTTTAFTVPHGGVLTATTTTVTASSVETDGNSAPVQLTAAVVPSAATGTVTFLDNGVAVGAAQLSGGIAISSPNLGLGYHTISASYAGDSSYATSTGSQQQQITVTPPGGSLHAIVPVRLLDTRNGTGAPKAKLAANGSLTLQVSGQGGIPATGVLGISVNVTVVQPIATGYVTLYPTGGQVPGTANIDFPKVVNTSGLVITPLSPSGQVTIVNKSAGPISLIADVSAWFAQQTGSLDAQGRYNPVAPLRILDTRTGIGVPKGKIKPNQTLLMKVAGMGEIPQTGVGAAMLNVTIVNPDLPVYLVLYPSDPGVTLPHASTDAFQKGETRAARVIVGVGTGGYVKIFSPYATADVVVDVVGWFTSTSSTAGGSTFVPLNVSKRLTPTQTGGSSWTKGLSRSVTIAGVNGIPTSTAAIHPLAVVTNLHVSAPTTGGYLFAYPLEPRTAGSDLNFIAGQTVQNLGVAKLGPSGAFNLFSTSQANITIDTYGWFG